MPIKIKKGANADEFEKLVAEQMSNIDVVDGSMMISAAKQIELSGGKKAIMIFVPYTQIKEYHQVQERLVQELEKKFSGRHIVIIAQRTILGKAYSRTKKTSGRDGLVRLVVVVRHKTSFLDDDPRVPLLSRNGSRRQSPMKREDKGYHDMIRIVRVTPIARWFSSPDGYSVSTLSFSVSFARDILVM